VTLIVVLIVVVVVVVVIAVAQDDKQYGVILEVIKNDALRQIEKERY